MALDGCWAAYSYDHGPYLLSVHPTEVEALRAAVDGYGNACFLPWGTSLTDAIERTHNDQPHQAEDRVPIDRAKP